MSTSTFLAPFIQVKEALVSYQSRIADNPSHIIYTLGLLGFYWYGLTVFMGPDGHLIAVGLLLLAFFGYWFRRIWPDLRQCSLFWVSLATTVYFLLRTFIACREFPEIVPFQIEMGLKMAHIGGLTSLLLVPWLYEKNKLIRVDWLFILIVISFLGNIYLTLDWNHFLSIISPYEYYYIEHQLRMNPNTAGFLGCMLILGLLTLTTKIVSEAKKQYQIIQILITTFSFLSIWIISFISINAESRAAWIAFGCVLPIWATLMIYNLIQQNKMSFKIWSIVTIVLLLMVYIGWSQSNQIVEQFQNESKTLHKLANGHFTNIPQKSVGKRIILWKFTYKKLIKRPIFGWGPGTFKDLVKKEGPKKVDHLGYNHNGFLQMLFQFGIAGGLLVFLLIYITVKSITSLKFNNNVLKEWRIYTIGCIVMILIFNLADSPFHHEQYRYILITLFSIALTCQLSQKKYDYLNL